jgi:23S rRNA pseudouridine1911/1915/1917 synthase
MAGKSAIKAPQDLQVLYEDNHLLAVNKPAGILVQGDASGDTSLMDLTREYIRNKYRKPGNVFVGLLHRLDRPVSGVVLFARTSKAASRISEQLRSRTVQKMYWALVHGRVKPPSGSLISYLLKGVTKVSLVGEEEASAQKALLSYRTLRNMKGKSLLEIQLHTGRKHQIRAQLAGLGYPIEGDVKYGAPYGLQDKSIRLMARSLTVKHPTRDKTITIEAPPPDWLS